MTEPNSELAAFVSAQPGDLALDRITPGRFRFHAHSWHGIDWLHEVSLTEGPGDLAILILTGGDANALDLAEQEHIARLSGLPVATLFHIPNQPIEDRWEDDLVAHTFERFIETRDATWPLLFPMTNSAIRAMDALQEATACRIRRFVVTGLSKRGWTTWLTAATKDPRVAGIAPMVIDNLNVGAQMHHQLETWGDYSLMIQDYTSRGLPSMVDTEEGKALARLVDPFEYRDSIRCPTLVVNGTNDPYWQVDALSNYWSELRQPRWASIVPNAGHLLGDQVQEHEALCGFSRSIAGEFDMPATSYFLKLRGDEVVAETNGPGEATLWFAESPSLDFRESEWTEAAQMRKGLPQNNLACMIATRHRYGSAIFTLTSPVSVFRARQ